MKLPSHTSYVLAFLEQYDPGTQFTSAWVADHLKLNIHRVSAAISLLIRKGVVKRAGKVLGGHRALVYELVEMKPVKTSHSKGLGVPKSKVGADNSTVEDLPQMDLSPKKEPSLVDRFLDLVAEVEKLKPLADYTNEELLAELRRRQAHVRAA